VRHGVVLDPRERANPFWVNVAPRTDRQVEADVAVEIAVRRVAWVAFLRAQTCLSSTRPNAATPDRQRRVDAVERARVCEEQTVRVDEEVADSLAEKSSTAGTYPHSPSHIP
jgi:hypothetical protein